MNRALRSIVVLAIAAGAAACADAFGPDSAGPLTAGSPRAQHGSGGGGDGGGGGGGGGGGDPVTPPPTPPAPPEILTGPLYLRESFGMDPLGLGAGTAQRYDTGGNLVQIGLATSIRGFRAEYPNTASEVWMTPDIRHEPTWAFAASTIDPTEPFSSFELPGIENGVLASHTKSSDPSNNNALLNFLQPEGPVTASVTLYSGAYTVSIGFTPSGALTGNFEQSGAAWLVIRMPRSNFLGSPATWELYTNGLSGPSASGTFMASTINPISVTYDPDAGTVVGSVRGVATPTLNYRVSGVKYVGFQGNGVVNNFRVEHAGALP